MKDSIDLRAAVAAALALILSGFAYRMLIEFSPASSVQSEVEALLFNNTSSGPPVVLVLAVWLFYRRWPRLRLLSTDAGSPGLAAVLFAPCLPIFAWANYTGVADLLVLALISNVAALTALCWGAAGLRVLWVPIVFLLFGIHAPAPVINEVLWKFQIWTANYTGLLLKTMGLSTFVTGDQIIRPDHNFAIIETCSGLRSLESLSMLAILMIDLFRRTGLHAAILLLLAPLISFIINGFRAVTIILNPHSEIVAVHTLQGVGVLMVGLLLLYAIDGWLERFLPTRKRVGRKPVESSERIPRAVWIVSIAVASVLAAISLWGPQWQAPGRGARPFPSSQIPADFEGWSSTRADFDRQFMGIVSFRARVDRRYERGDDSVRLFAGVGGHEKPRVSPFSPKTALPGSGWWVEWSGVAKLDPDARPVRASVVRFGKGARRKLVFDWREGTAGFASEVVRSASGLDKSAWARPREGVSLRLSTRLRDLSEAERDASEERLREFYRTFRPRLDLLGTPRGQ